jgi:hypothetical protein
MKDPCVILPNISANAGTVSGLHVMFNNKTNLTHINSKGLFNRTNFVKSVTNQLVFRQYRVT